MERWEKGGGGAASSGRERDHSRLLFCVAFFHCLAAARGRFGARCVCLCAVSGLTSGLIYM